LIILVCFIYYRAWRQKIEAWLQENEKEEKDSNDLRRKTQRIQSNRKSLENDSESDGRSSILDTLPEGKLADVNNDEYKRVYSDWRPTIDKTDVVGVMEAIAGKLNRSLFKTIPLTLNYFKSSTSN
jgi:hypothetical protein